MKLTQEHDVSAKTVHATLHNDLPLSRSRLGGRSNCFTREQRRSNPERDRLSQRCSPRLFNYLGQHSHCWWVGQGRRAISPASASISRPPRKSWRGYKKWSPRRSSSNESAAKNTSTSLGPTLKKAKNKCGSIFNCLNFIEVFRELSKLTLYVLLTTD
jgi:hypothetical protein